MLVAGCQGSEISVNHTGAPTAADKHEFSLASLLAKDADATVLVVGMLVLREESDPKFGTSCCEGEGNDRDGYVHSLGFLSMNQCRVVIGFPGLTNRCGAVSKFPPCNWRWSRPLLPQPPPQRNLSSLWSCQEDSSTSLRGNQIPESMPCCGQDVS